MKGIMKYGLATVAAVLLSACGSSSDDESTVVLPELITEVRVHHTVADAPNVNVLVNGGAAVEDAGFGASSTVLELDAGTYSLQVDAILADGSTATVIGPVNDTLAANTRYEILAIGKVADETIQPLIITNLNSEIADGNARLQVVHAAPDAPLVDIYLTAPDADLSASSPAATLAFSDFTGQVEVPAGDYQVRITPAGDPATVVFDSGTLPLTAGADLIVSAVTNTKSGSSPVMLQVADGSGASIVTDINAGADVRIVHSSADAPTVDFVADGDMPATLATLSFGQFTDYLNVADGDYLIDVIVNGTTTVALNDIPLSLAQGEIYSVYAIGSAGDGSLTAGVLTPDTRRIATEAKLQAVHASPTAGDVDIYVTATDDITSATPAFTAVPFTTENGPASTGYVSLMPGDYYVTITPTGTKDAAIGPELVTLEGNGIYTAVAVDAVGGGVPLNVIAMDDFATVD